MFIPGCSCKTISQEWKDEAECLNFWLKKKEECRQRCAIEPPSTSFVYSKECNDAHRICLEKELGRKICMGL